MLTDQPTNIPHLRSRYRIWLASRTSSSSLMIRYQIQHQVRAPTFIFLSFLFYPSSFSHRPRHAVDFSQVPTAIVPPLPPTLHIMASCYVLLTSFKAGHRPHSLVSASSSLVLPLPLSSVTGGVEPCNLTPNSCVSLLVLPESCDPVLVPPKSCDTVLVPSESVSEPTLYCTHTQTHSDSIMYS